MVPRKPCTGLVNPRDRLLGAENWGVSHRVGEMEEEELPACPNRGA